MPKVIENPRDRLVAEAREQVCRAGYSGMTAGRWKVSLT